MTGEFHHWSCFEPVPTPTGMGQNYCHQICSEICHDSQLQMAWGRHWANASQQYRSMKEYKLRFGFRTFNKKLAFSANFCVSYYRSNLKWRIDAGNLHDHWKGRGRDCWHVWRHNIDRFAYVIDDECSSSILHCHSTPADRYESWDYWTRGIRLIRWWH